MGARVYYPRESLRDGSDPVLVTPEAAGWAYSGLRIVELAPGEERVIATGDAEMAVLPLAGSFTVECEGRRFALAGREDVFSRVSDFAYLPIDAEARVAAAGGGRLALPSAKATRRLDPAYGAARDVRVEIRGAGQATRQINNFLAPQSLEADKLVAVEVLTPDGNWSSYPPHKHDEASESEAVLEEIYYFEVRGDAGFALQRLYTADGEIDATETVRSGDVFLIPRGYHGPSIAPPGYELYYLNVLAGPAEERTMAFCTDPAHDWLWGAWQTVAADPRAPLTTAQGRR
ncbi:MAG TPA: 5-deoxy-glucuronate isomerase [Egibacteraceae bacterium]|nr:5-deoxy-glucuronate isomerase [Egibacteraceae bacterium]